MRSIWRRLATSTRARNPCEGVLEVVEEHEGNAFRAVYTVTFGQAVYALHVFQKKSSSGIATRKEDMELIRQRLKLARGHYKQEFGK